MQVLPISDIGKAIYIMTLAAVAVESGRYDMAQWQRMIDWVTWRYRWYYDFYKCKRLDKSLAADVLNGVIRARLQ